MLTRKEIIDYTVRMGCKRDLIQKGMVASPSGDVYCIATLSGPYQDGIYYDNGQKSPKDVYYFGVNSIRASDPLDPTDSESRKNIAVTKTDGVDKFVYFFEKTGFRSKEYYFHGRYKYMNSHLKENPDIKRPKDIIFHLIFVDRPVLK